MHGIHIVASLYECKGDDKFLWHEAPIKAFCQQSVLRSGLTIVQEVFHPFEKGGVTGCLVLSESHLAIHTWPELRSVTLDIYACNYTKDNTEKARQVMKDFLALYKPQRSVIHEVPRDQQFLYEHMNPDYGFFVRSTSMIESKHTGIQSLEIHQTPQFGKLLRLDGYFMTSEKEEFVYHETMIHPAMCAQAQPRHVLIIGGGDGGAAEEVLKHPSVESVTLVELDPEVIASSKLHLQHVHHGVFNHPKLRVLCEDGLQFIANDRGSYDHIVLDLPDPLGPAQQLYESDFLQSCKLRLSPQGTLNIHTGSPWAHPDRVRSTFLRLSSIFQHAALYTVFIPLYGTLWSMCVCSDGTKPDIFSAADIDQRLLERGIRDLHHYSGAIHQSLFALPPFIQKIIETKI